MRYWIKNLPCDKDAVEAASAACDALTDEQLKAGEVNLDGKVNVIDVTLIQRCLAGMKAD